MVSWSANNFLRFTTVCFLPEMPDLCNGKILKILKAWQGEAKYLQNIKLRRVKKLTETESNENEEEEVGEDEDIQGEEELKEFVDEDDERSKLDEGSKKDDEDMEDKTWSQWKKILIGSFNYVVQEIHKPMTISLIGFVI